MAKEKNFYELAVERARLSAEARNASEIEVRTINTTLVTEGSWVQIPNLEDDEEFEVFAPKSGGQFIIAADGSRLWLSSLTRGAKNHETDEFTPPTGSAVEECQKYSNWQDFLSDHRGEWLHFASKTVVPAMFRGQDKPSDVNVWHIDLYETKEEDKPKTTKRTKKQYVLRFVGCTKTTYIFLLT